jgi:hypothetical protein
MKAIRKSRRYYPPPTSLIGWQLCASCMRPLAYLDALISPKMATWQMRDPPYSIVCTCYREANVGNFTDNSNKRLRPLVSSVRIKERGEGCCG